MTTENTTTAKMRALRAAHDCAVQSVNADSAEWEKRGYGGEAQDSEEAEYSGYLTGYAEGIEEAIGILTRTA